MATHYLFIFPLWGLVSAGFGSPNGDPSRLGYIWASAYCFVLFGRFPFQFYLEGYYNYNLKP